MGGGRSQADNREFVLGLEGGGTRSTALFVNPSGEFQQRLMFGPLNLQSIDDLVLQRVLQECRARCRPHPAAVAICLAGCRCPADRDRVQHLARQFWPRARLFIGNDLDSGHAAAFGLGPGILVIAGTGSVVYGRNRAGRTARAGGWGHQLGDHGSGYWLALQNLQAELRRFDHTGRTSRALQRVLAHLALNHPNQLLAWIRAADKSAVAELAPPLIRANPALLEQALDLLAADIRAVSRQLRMRVPELVLAGGCARNPMYVRGLRQRFPQLRLLEVETAVGAVRLAAGSLSSLGAGWQNRASSLPLSPAPFPSGGLPLTEQRNPRTLDLDRQSVPELVATMLGEEARVVPALRRAAPELARAITVIVGALRRGGRLFYVGAGTSGRLGVLDASECPPTFSTDPQMVQGIIAGGAPALTRAVEAAEDNAAAGAAALRDRGVGRGDVVVGIAASGRTPFVLGALDQARARRARTYLLCFAEPASRRHPVLLVRTGPEVLTGSTRLKAGTATKLVLNMLSTIAMVRLGKVASNLMVDVRPTNAKLQARAVRILATLLGCPAAQARARLERSGWNIKRAAGTRSAR